MQGANLKTDQHWIQMDRGRDVRLKILHSPLLFTLTECKVIMLSCTCYFKLPHILELTLMPAISYHLKGLVSKAVSFSRSAVVQMKRCVCTRNVWIHKQNHTEIRILAAIGGRSFVKSDVTLLVCFFWVIFWCVFDQEMEFMLYNLWDCLHCGTAVAEYNLQATEMSLHELVVK